MKSDVPGVFCAGADLKERKEMKSEDVGPMVARFRSRVTELGDLPMPVIGALDGSALGGGLEIALGLDIRIAGGFFGLFVCLFVWIHPLTVGVVLAILYSIIIATHFCIFHSPLQTNCCLSMANDFYDVVLQLVYLPCRIAYETHSDSFHMQH